MKYLCKYFNVFQRPNLFIQQVHGQLETNGPHIVLLKRWRDVHVDIQEPFHHTTFLSLEKNNLLSWELQGWKLFFFVWLWSWSAVSCLSLALSLVMKQDFYKPSVLKVSWITAHATIPGRLEHSIIYFCSTVLIQMNGAWIMVSLMGGLEPATSKSWVLWHNH